MILPTPLSEVDVLRADKYAEEMHRGQVRKIDGVTPFIEHPRRVAHLVRGFSRLSGDMLILAIVVALLHDTVEDTKATLEDIAQRFGTFVAVSVGAMTNNPEIKCPGVSKMARLLDRLYRIRAQCGLVVQLVELADRGANLEEIPGNWSRHKLQAYTQDEAAAIQHMVGMPGNALHERLYAQMVEARLRYALRPPRFPV